MQIADNIFREFSDITPKNISILRNEGRLIAKIEVDENVYFLKGERQTNEFIETVISFVTAMNEKGIPFTRLEKTIDGHQYVEASGFIFTVEKKSVGEEVERLRFSHINDIGKMLGKQHAVSETLDVCFGTATSWSIFGGNETDALGDYDENELSFKKFMQDAEKLSELSVEVELIKNSYLVKRERLSTVWETLPSGPIQGDFCPYNMLFSQDGKITSIYDYNIAGDEVFLNECIGVGVFLAWHHPYIGAETEVERFYIFMNAYMQERPFTEAESAVFDDLLAIIRAFRYDRVEEIVQLLREGKDAQRFIKEAFEILQWRCR
ncbi:phosphotransferase enzyme family protein [Sporosarcina limicola]|uniref:Ser/Thr protein kinase RdoA (MazF antagonist) n=1 Tax=Sporosarcina limicola TaxID=34101 RepID=A0A927R4P4_9BACL|nr:hypothetical protein [Sporosarcina limicola]MBE1555123.1 Ser/Thr protein kinase RdoA (MazF antagonist) [Sporosarcina limicola]